MKGDAARATEASSFRQPALHILVLWSFAVAQPLYEIVRRNREFFVAHRADPLDLLLLAAAVSLGLPAVLVAAAAAGRRVSRPIGRALLLAAVAVLVAAIVAQPLARGVALPALRHYAVAGAIGIAAAWLYAVASPARLFFTILSPAILLFPAILLLHPDMASFVRPDRRLALVSGQIPGDPPPIVMVVFDQLPLTSLMTEGGEIDAVSFPGFARLARASTWYRNATTVADFTGFAVPPIVTGLRPRRRHLPVASDYPQNLFTFLSPTYRLEVSEAITALCPESLCPRERPPALRRLASMLLDLSVVYLHVVLPAEHRAELPALTDDWRDFAQGQNWHRRWVAERDLDRRRPLRDFVNAISREDPQPTFYFLHALLPHEPYMYLPTGQRFTTQPRLTGLARRSQWVSEEWAVAEQYRRHLVQLQYVDGALSRLLGRLESEGLWERALVVVTADHGVSFRPDEPFKFVRRSTVEDIMPVPLFIKAPGQTAGAVSDANVESPDILPTIADLLGTTLTWAPDGTSARSRVQRPATKTIRHTGAAREITVSAEELAARRDRAVLRKVRLFGRGENPLFVPTTAPRRDLIGRPAASLPVTDGAGARVLVNDAARFREVDPEAPVVPAQITGRVVDETGAPLQAELAISLNGTVAATTRTYGFLSGPAGGTWTALLDPKHLRKGRNDVDIFVLRDHPRGVQLARAYTSSGRPDTLNLASPAARDHWAVQQSGLHEPEGSALPYRWTNGEAVLVVPMDVNPRPLSLRVGLAHGPPRGPVTIRVNDCILFNEPLPSVPWYRTFSLRDCPPAMTASEARIVVGSATRTLLSGEEARPVGVAVETLNLFASEWPLPPTNGRARLEVRPLKGAGATHIRGSGAAVEIVNRGDAVLPSRTDGGKDGVDLELRWTGERAATQRLALPRTLYPSERVIVDLPLMPPQELEGPGPWTLQVVPVRADGRPVPLESPCVLTVVPEP